MQAMQTEEETQVHAFEQELIKRIQEVSGSFAQALFRAYQPLGLTPPQAMVLGELLREDGQKVSQLAAKLHTKDSNISMICQRLERKGYLSRDRSPDDQRVVRVTLTEQSREKAWSLKQNLLQNVFPKLSALPMEEKELILKGLKSLSACLSEAECSGWDEEGLPIDPDKLSAGSEGLSMDSQTE